MATFSFPCVVYLVSYHKLNAPQSEIFKEFTYLSISQMRRKNEASPSGWVLLRCRYKAIPNVKHIRSVPHNRVNGAPKSHLMMNLEQSPANHNKRFIIPWTVLAVRSYDNPIISCDLSSDTRIYYYITVDERGRKKWPKYEWSAGKQI